MADTNPRTITGSVAIAQMCAGDWRAELASWDIGRSTIGPVSIYTSWLPLAGYYESLVTGPDALLAVLGYPSERTDTREAARDMHASLVVRVRRVVDDSACV